MNKLQFLNLLLGLNLLLLISGCQTKDQKYSNEIVGNYFVEGKEKDTEGKPLLMNVSFNKDHTLIYYCEMDYSWFFTKKTLSFKANGHWEIKDGFLISTYDGFIIEPIEISGLVQKEMEDIFNQLSRNPFDEIMELNMQRLVLSGADGELTYLQRNYSKRNSENNLSIKKNDLEDVNPTQIIENQVSLHKQNKPTKLDLLMTKYNVKPSKDAYDNPILRIDKYPGGGIILYLDSPNGGRLQSISDPSKTGTWSIDQYDENVKKLNKEQTTELTTTQPQTQPAVAQN